MHKHDTTIQYVNEDNQLEKIFEIYLSECQYVKLLSPSTIKGYRDVFRTFQSISPESTCIKNIHPHTLVEFFHRLGTRIRYVGSQQKIGVRASTVSTYYNKLMAFFRWLEVNGYLKRGYITKVMKRPPAPKYTDERALPLSKVHKIVSSIVVSTVDDEYLRVRDLTLIYSLLYLGVRRGELLGLRISDFDFENKRVYINEKTSKSEKSRYIPLHPVLSDKVKQLLRLRNERGIVCEYLITSIKKDRKLTVHGLKHWVERYKRLSGIKFHLHMFRHTFTCELAKNGADKTSIMELLGHTSSEMTEIYLRSLRTKNSQKYIEQLAF